MKIDKDGKMEILLVEDNAGDVGLVKEALEDSVKNYNLSVIRHGDLVMDYLKHVGEYRDKITPDLILLDLNLPGKNGKDILKDIKNDKKLEVIPIIILTSSTAENDIEVCYRLKANSYVVKPVDFDQFMHVIRDIKDYWIATVTLPPKIIST